MGDRFLLDRVDMSSDDFPVNEKLQFSPNVLPDAAQSDLTLGYVAIPSACSASDSRVRKRLVQQSFFYHASNLSLAGNNFSRRPGPLNNSLGGLKSLSLPLNQQYKFLRPTREAAR